jgi:hypothetical protein
MTLHCCSICKIRYECKNRDNQYVDNITVHVEPCMKGYYCTCDPCYQKKLSGEQ